MCDQQGGIISREDHHGRGHSAGGRQEVRHGHWPMVGDRRGSSPTQGIVLGVSSRSSDSPSSTRIRCSCVAQATQLGSLQ
jgi:hypothetical protein